MCKKSTTLKINGAQEITSEIPKGWMLLAQNSSFSKTLAPELRN